MRTNKVLSETISIAASPGTVFDLVSDPRQLPRWAPGVGRSVRRDGDDWVIVNGENEARITVRASREHGVVDLLAAHDHSQGVFTRVLPQGDGAEYQFTMFFPPDAPDEAIAAQRAVVRGELDTVRALCEGPG
ncbi:SRPBCC family protein [Amycolatopsis viridis]|uniref:Uncharacterized protein YndB with AHSA1/START domain n=1 Tax=Amycolatopsis viridis TaxID=185678 RepID=A0ABX0SWI3_9PSEU|nr:SRPBCC family protein [Amycolatopsis viridis]NIH81318.1 uncharacterized protein YndB with AHSA1/START domain [Amycolatopsis viridis]